MNGQLEVISFTFILKSTSKSSKVHSAILFLSFFKKEHGVTKIVKCGEGNIILKQMFFTVI